MTGHKNRPVRAGGVLVADVLTSQLGPIVQQVLDRLRADLPAYRLMPSEELAGDIRGITEQNLRTFAGVLRTGEPPDEAVLAALRESIGRRAEEDVPLGAVLAAYHLGARVAVEFVAGRFEPGELADAIELSRRTLDYLGLVSATLAGGYLDEWRTMVADEHATRQSVLSALLDGGPADLAPGPQPASYRVLAFRFGVHPDESSPEVDPGIARRRKLRRLRTELERRRDQPVSMLSGDGGIALLPANELAPTAAELVTLEELRAAMSRAGAVDVTIAVSSGEPGRLPAAAALARELIEVTQAFRLPPGVYRLDDLLLEYQLTRPGPARDQLAEVLRPLDGRPDLLDTLRAYLDSDRNRRRTAGSLHVHPNTVDYRLRRIGQLTGMDAARPEQLPRLVAALAAHDAR